MTASDDPGDRRFRLAPMAEIVAAPDLPPSLGVSGDVLAAVRGSRQPPCLLSADAAALLQRFREPMTLTDGIRAHSLSTGADPLATLNACFPVLIELSRHGLLEPADQSAPPGRPVRAAGDIVGPAVLDAPVRQVSDTEIWRGHLAERPDRPVAVKIIDDPAIGPGLVAAEAAALRRLRGRGVPRLRRVLPTDTGGTLITDWIDGDPVDLAAHSGPDRINLARAVLVRYAALHRAGLLHGDVHAGNVMVTANGPVLLDFGLARPITSGSGARPGGGESLDPPAAHRLLAGQPPPTLDASAEQYAVATLLFRIICGASYLDLEVERAEALRRIGCDQPRRFAGIGGPCWPAGERVLRRALRKDPARRYPDLSAMLGAFDAALRRPAHWFAVDHRLRNEVVRAAADLDTGGRWWPCHTDPQAAAHAAEFLRRAAMLAGDPDVAELATVWSALADGRSVPEPPDGSPVATFHRALASYLRTGRSGTLDRAARLVEHIAAQADPITPNVHVGPLAALLARTQLADPWQAADADAVQPPAPMTAAG